MFVRYVLQLRLFASDRVFKDQSGHSICPEGGVCPMWPPMDLFKLVHLRLHSFLTWGPPDLFKFVHLGTPPPPGPPDLFKLAHYWAFSCSLINCHFSYYLYLNFSRNVNFGVIYDGKTCHWQRQGQISITKWAQVQQGPLVITFIALVFFLHR